ncbi:hypothetical protein MMC22_003551 [Lobaria immixta]|nr:hypothetical protein [Lobaria immixta]
MDQIGESSPGKPGVVCPGIANEHPIASRIRHSASGLISNAFSKPSPSFATSSLACISGEGSKGGSAFASTNSSELASSSVHQSSQYSSMHGDQDRGPNVATDLEGSQLWRAGGDNNSCQSAFEDFTSQEGPLPQLQQDLYALSESQVNIGYHSSNKLWVRDGETCGAAPPELSSIWSRDSTRPAPCIHLDGAAVVAILCDPEFSPDEDHANLVRCPTNDSKEIHEDIPQMCSFVDLHEPSTVSSSRIANLDYDFSNEKLSIATGRVSQEIIGIEPNKSCDLMKEDRKLLPWLKNFKNYQDEVWGNMLYPAHGSYREKVAQGNGHESVITHGTAERLEMIVRHIHHAIK